MLGRLRGGLIGVALAGLALVSCRPGRETGLGPDSRRGLERGRDAAASWILGSRGAIPLPDSAVIALGYLERLRLGLGSPFRLIDYALHDPRLTDSVRVHLSWALLARTVDELSYQIDPIALDRMAPSWQGSDGWGAYHLKLIESTVRRSRDPRSGELAVRLAYALAAADGSLSPRAPQLAAQVAALVRDRQVAHMDALNLLRAAAQAGRDPLALLPEWRVEHRFQVERPTVEPLPATAEREGAEIAVRLAGALRELGAGLAASSAAGRGPSPLQPSLLGFVAAQRLSNLADSLDMPPESPVAVAAAMYRTTMVDAPDLTTDERDRRRRFVDRATAEERFVAEYALLRNWRRQDATPSVVALWAAVGLRPYGQEAVWYPGYGGPSTRELEERYGLAGVRFDKGVPASWRPYLRRMLDVAFTDLHRVLPALELDGLTVVFTWENNPPGVLALHDPRRRRILLPATSAAGTIAHEAAHDLDWQVALRRYRVRGDYASDRASRIRGDRLAVRLRDMAGTRLQLPVNGRPPDHARRPAEVFARNIDWFVAMSLAAEGRMDGYLSSVQDDILTGYGTARPPDIGGTAGDALMNVLDEISPVHPATREWFMRTYGLSRALTPYDLVRRVVEEAGEDATALVLPAVSADPVEDTPPLTASAAARAAYDGVRQAMQAASAAIDAWVCRTPGAAYAPELEAARRRLVAAAGEARARGIALSLAQQLAGYRGRQFMARRFYGEPWTATRLPEGMTSLLSELADSARTVGQLADRPEDLFDLGAPTRRCAESLWR